MVQLFEKINSLFVSKVYANNLADSIKSEVANLEGGASDVPTLVAQIVRIAGPLAVISAFLLLVYGGYLLTSSQGNPDKLQEAKSVITNAIIGLLVVLLSVGILLILSNALNLGAYK